MTPGVVFAITGREGGFSQRLSGAMRGSCFQWPHGLVEKVTIGDIEWVTPPDVASTPPPSNPFHHPEERPGERAVTDTRNPLSLEGQAQDLKRPVSLPEGGSR
jgi:hypothetical protein